MDKGKITYRKNWVTDIVITEDNVRQLVKGGRVCWKVEYEGFNALENFVASHGDLSSLFTEICRRRIISLDINENLSYIRSCQTDIFNLTV